ncbi:hypothetical protein CEXT_294721 [Caerostris extrusa]|uniref:Uncharacterized protein n=1 Tax=Caerostris extrusa TaxID=172846 RepID=A0AAV4PEW7_CAEEX|nr:hypothetical protein CEXT_294721 [Caerostris extrusa]
MRRKQPSILKLKGLDTIDKFSQGNLAIAYTNGSSDKFFNKGSTGIFSYFQMEISQYDSTNIPAGNKSINPAPFQPAEIAMPQTMTLSEDLGTPAISA